MKRLNYRLLFVRALFSTLAALPVHAGSFTITPTFDSSIASDPHAAAIEATIDQAIQVYENLFSNPINVTIDFQEMSSGLGQSSKELYGVNYSDFYTNYSANAADNNDPVAQTALASGVVPNQAGNPVTGGTLMAVSTADLKALGFGIYPGVSVGPTNTMESSLCRRLSLRQAARDRVSRTT